MLYLPDRAQTVRAHPSFRLFSTRSIVGNSTLRSASPLPNFHYFGNMWLAVEVEEQGEAEVEHLLNEKFPNLHSSAKQKLLTTFFQFNHFADAEGGSTLRTFTLRDLMKSVGRINKRVSFNHSSDYLPELQRLSCVAELLDVFVFSIRDPKLLPAAVKSLSLCWDVAEDLLYEKLFRHRPSMNIGDSLIQIGRVVLTPSAHELTSDRSLTSFANTNHSLRFIERLAAAVASNEPVLLVGETGGGKTTVIQILAKLCSQKLMVQNLSLSTDSSDLVGGFKPVSMSELFRPSYEEFINLFRQTFPSEENVNFVQAISTAFRKKQWEKLIKAFQKSVIYAFRKLSSCKADSTESSSVSLQSLWTVFSQRVDRFAANLSRIESGFAFAYMDGVIIQAMRAGQWVLLDEINLAAPETLQVLSGILDGRSFCITEKGEMEVVKPHENFRIFAAMNPPTDVGKKELPAALRARFTELFVDEMTDALDLRVVVEELLKGVVGIPLEDIVDLYLACRAAAADHLEDGAGLRPRYSLRSLTRALRAVPSFMEIGIKPVLRAVYEGFLLTFQMQLSDSSKRFMSTYLQHSLKLNKDLKALIHPPPRPGGRTSG